MALDQFDSSPLLFFFSLNIFYCLSWLELLYIRLVWFCKLKVKNRVSIECLLYFSHRDCVFQSNLQDIIINVMLVGAGRQILVRHFTVALIDTHNSNQPYVKSFKGKIEHSDCSSY